MSRFATVHFPAHTHRWSRRQIRNISAPLAMVIESDMLKTNLSLVSNLAPLPELQVLQSFQLQGALPPDPVTGGSAPMDPNGVSAPEPYIGSRSCSHHDLWCMYNRAQKILWPRARQSHNPALDVAMVWSSLLVTGLRALGAKSVIYDCLVTIAPLYPDLCPLLPPLCQNPGAAHA